MQTEDAKGNKILDRFRAVQPKKPRFVAPTPVRKTLGLSTFGSVKKRRVESSSEGRKSSQFVPVHLFSCYFEVEFSCQVLV